MNKFNKNIIIVGTARSGTSWLSETIAQQKRYRMLFEPEQETKTKNGYLLCDQWLEKPSDSIEAHKYLKQVFSNRVDCDWIGQNSNRKFKRHLWPFIPKKHVVKFVRANLSAKYMNESFRIPVIHMIRDPYDVLFSQLRANFTWLTDLEKFTNQQNLVNLIKEQFDINLISYSQLSKLEILTLRWCIENVIPLEVLEPYSYHSKVVRYENLFSDINIFYDLCDKFNIVPIKDIERFYFKPSTKTHRESSIKTKEVKKATFGKNELIQINGILDAFQTKLYPRKY